MCRIHERPRIENLAIYYTVRGTRMYRIASLGISRTLCIIATETVHSQQSIVCANSPVYCKHDALCGMALVRDFPCQSAFRHDTCRFVLRANYLAIL